MTKAYYNEFDPFAAAWLRQLITAGHIAPGDVDERSISDVQPDDLKGYTQCHFFAGIGGWSYALRLAGWPDDQPVWTGSCPCQPFSVAGKRKGVDDERHLWPQFARLIGTCQPSVVFGEQVASKDGRTWLAAVFADLENMAYRRAGADLCAAGVGAPHIRQRLYWVGHRIGTRMARLEQSKCASETAVVWSSEAHMQNISIAPFQPGHSWPQPLIRRMADGVSNELGSVSYKDRKGSMRGYGNAIVPQLAATFIEAYVEALND